MSDQHIDFQGTYEQLLSFFKQLYDLNYNQAKEIVHTVFDVYNVL